MMTAPTPKIARKNAGTSGSVSPTNPPLTSDTTAIRAPANSPMTALKAPNMVAADATPILLMTIATPPPTAGAQV
jgi:hypothetical protein